MEETSPAEHAKESLSSGTDPNTVRTFREGERAKMAKTLDRLLRVAKREARRRASPGLIRLKWVNTICYLTQTYNSLLKDVEIDELKAGMIALQETVKKISQSRHQQSQTNTRTG